MKLSTKGRYAARAMLELSLRFDGHSPVMLKDVAKQQDISVRYLENIMTPLVSSGFVNSLRGKNGGFLLAKHPSKITLKDVICAVEGEISPVHCVSNPKSCNKVSGCVTHDIWNRIKIAINNVLESVTLSELVDMHKNKMAREGFEMYHI